MTTDTSAEALEQLANSRDLWPSGYPFDWILHDTLLALAAEKRHTVAAEKRRARDGVTDDVVKRASAIYMRRCFYGVDMTAMRAALEAVWPDGRDAKVNYKPCASVCNGEVHVYMDDTDEGKYVAIVLVDAEGYPLDGSGKRTSANPEGARGQSLKRTGEHAPNSSSHAGHRP